MYDSKSEFARVRLRALVHVLACSVLVSCCIPIKWCILLNAVYACMHMINFACYLCMCT